jgi:hypothetical protein
MPVSAGTKIGLSEILAPIGKGGMGEVYRARDTKLKREVAIGQYLRILHCRSDLDAIFQASSNQHHGRLKKLGMSA